MVYLRGYTRLPKATVWVIIISKHVLLFVYRGVNILLNPLFILLPFVIQLISYKPAPSFSDDWFQQYLTSLQIYTVFEAVSDVIIERMRAPVRHISYGIRHTVLSRTYAIVAYVRHNNDGIPLYLVFQHFPIEMNRLSSRWSSSTHGTSALTQVFDSKHMNVKKNGRRH